MKKEIIQVPRATLNFYKYEENSLTYYEFNATECQPPEPMVNTMVAMSLLKSESDRVVGIYFHEPFPMYERLPAAIKRESSELENGDIRVEFRIE